MTQTIPHIVRMCRYPFSERVLAIDTTPPSGDYLSRPCIGELTELREHCDRLLTCGTVDRVVDVDFSQAYMERVYRKHLGAPVRQSHNFRGAPVLGYIFLLEEVRADYLLHFNTDMLLYQRVDFDWVGEGIDKLSEYPDVVCVTPLSGPPAEDGLLHQGVPYCRDHRGFYQFKQFTSRKFLVDVRRFERLLPLGISFRTETRRSSPSRLLEGLDRWENMVSNRLRATPYVRIDLGGGSVWALHSSQTHDRTFLDNLPRIIERIESGWYPIEQAGHYNLLIESWLSQM